MKAFLSYPYIPTAEVLAADVGNFLERNDIVVVDGRIPDASKPLAEEITSRISQCQILICLVFDGTDSAWVHQEIGVAIGRKLDVIAITSGVAPKLGILQHHFQLRAEERGLALASVLKESIESIRRRRGFDATDTHTRVETGQHFPDKVNSEYGNACALRDESAYQKAIEHYERVVALAQDHYKAIYNIGYCLRHLGSFEEATQNYLKLSGLLERPSEHDPGLLFLRAHCYIELCAIEDRIGGQQAAYDYLHTGLALLPNEPLFYLNLLVICAKLHKENEARAWYRRLVEGDAADKLLKTLPIEDLNILKRFPWFKGPDSDRGHIT